MASMLLFRLQRTCSTASQNSSNDPSGSKSSQPQTLEELLERQWEQGSQFLMEQASHFDSKTHCLLYIIGSHFGPVS